MNKSVANQVWYSAVAGFSLFVIALGINRFSYNPILPFLADAQWATNTEAQYIGAANFLGYFLGAYSAQRITKFFPHPKILICLLGLSILASFLCIFNFNYIWLSFWRLVLGMIAGGIMVLAPTIILQGLNQKKKNFVSGIMFSGIGVGIAGCSLFIPYFYQLGGMVSIWVSLTLFTICFVLLALKKCLNDVNKHEQKKIISQNISLNLAQKRIYRFAMIGYLLYGIGLAPSLLLLSDYVHVRLNLTLQTSSDLFALFGVGCVFGSLISGWMNHQFGNYLATIISAIIGVISLATIILSHDYWAIAISAFLSGYYLIALILCSSLLVVNLVGMEHHSKYWSQMTAGYAAVQFIAGYVFLYLLTLGLSYHDVFFIAMLILILSLVSYLLAKEK